VLCLFTSHGKVHEFGAEKPISWAKPAHFDFFPTDFTVWSHTEHRWRFSKTSWNVSDNNSFKLYLLNFYTIFWDWPWTTLQSSCHKKFGSFATIRGASIVCLQPSRAQVAQVLFVCNHQGLKWLKYCLFVNHQGYSHISVESEIGSISCNGNCSAHSIVLFGLCSVKWFRMVRQSMWVRDFLGPYTLKSPIKQKTNIQWVH